MAEEHNPETGEIIEAEPQPPAVPVSASPRQFLTASPQTDQVWTALAEAQANIEAPQRTKKGVFGKYAPLDEILDKIRDPLHDVGLGKQQYLVNRGGIWVLRTVIFHSSGQWVASDYPIYFDERKGAQGFAGGVTYARRYGLMLALGLAAEDDESEQATAAAGIPQTPQRTAPPIEDPIIKAGWIAADTGDLEKLQSFWNGLTPAQRKMLGPDRLALMKEHAAKRQEMA